MFAHHWLSGTSSTPCEFVLLITCDLEMAIAWLGWELGESLRPFCLTTPALSTSSLFVLFCLFSPACTKFWLCWVLDHNLLFSLCNDKPKRGGIFGYVLPFLTNGPLLSFVFQICIWKAGFSCLLCFPPFLCLEFLLCFSAGLESHLLTEVFHGRRSKTISNFFTLPLYQFLIFNSLNALKHKLSTFAELQFCAIRCNILDSS